MKSLRLAAFCGAMTLVCASASAGPITLTFEGLGDEAAINDFYNGGTDSQGNSGTNYGVSFSDTSLALIDSDAGGSGNFANEPSPNTILFFLDSNSATLNYAAGFTTGFSFYYSSSTDATVNVWSGLNATGDLLGQITVAAQSSDNGCVGDPNGTYCNWTAAGVSFLGIAHSIDFDGTADLTGYDNITFGSDTPGNPGVPEPASWALMLAGFGLVGGSLRRHFRARILFA